MIYEKSPNKRKACAGGLSWRVIKRYRELLNDSPLYPVNFFKFEFDYRKFEFSFKKPVIYVTDRLTFDRNLREIAKSYDINFVYKKCDIKKLKNDIVIDARGFVSANQIGASISAICKFKNPVMTIVFNRKINPMGHFWVFPISDNYASVGIFGLSKSWRIPIETAFKMLIKRYKLKIIEKYAAPISLDCGDVELGYKRGNTTVLKIGEAGRLVNPITGEGIYYGIRSGELAAKSLLDDKPINTYNNLIRKEILSEFRIWEVLYNILISTPTEISKNIFKLILILGDRTQL